MTTLAFFLAQWLLPRLPNFTAQHPNTDVQIHTSVDLADFVKAGIDAGIRFGAGTWPRLHAQKLLDEWLVPVCTPMLLPQHGPITGRAVQSERAYFFVCPLANLALEKVAVFREWLTTERARFPSPPIIAA